MRESAHDDKNFEKSLWNQIVRATRRDAAGTVSTNKIKGSVHFSLFTFHFKLFYFYPIDRRARFMR